MHNHEDSGFKMMWLMALCCFGPLVIVFVANKTGYRLSNWWIFGLIAVCIIAHFIMHGRHKNTKIKASEVAVKPEDNNPEF